MPVFYSAKYQDTNGRWIYTQNKDQKAEGDRITQWVFNKWQPHAIYYHFRSGGHVEAIRNHLKNSFFLKADIQQFFNHVSRGKIIRCLVKAGFSYKTAHDFAMRSTVYNDELKKYVLPFGFVQSPLLATLALQKSLLGKTLISLKNQGKLRVSVYMDDILLSSDSAADLLEAKTQLLQAAEKSSFPINAEKSTEPLQQLAIFNIDIYQQNMSITDERMRSFAQKIIESGDGYVRDGIIGYVHTVNPAQAKTLSALMQEGNPIH